MKVSTVIKTARTTVSVNHLAISNLESVDAIRDGSVQIVHSKSPNLLLRRSSSVVAKQCSALKSIEAATNRVQMGGIIEVLVKWVKCVPDSRTTSLFARVILLTIDVMTPLFPVMFVHKVINCFFHDSMAFRGLPFKDIQGHGSFFRFYSCFCLNNNSCCFPRA